MHDYGRKISRKGSKKLLGRKKNFPRQVNKIRWASVGEAVLNNKSVSPLVL